MSTLTSAPRATPRRSTASRAAGYVVGLMWGLPLLAFTVAYVVADDQVSPVFTARDTVVFGAVFAATLLIPLGLVALLLVSFLAATWRSARPSALAAVSAGSALAVGILVVVIMNWVAG